MQEQSRSSVAATATASAGKEAVGYLKGRGGAGTTLPDETISEWRLIFAELRSRIDTLEAEAIELEQAMAQVGAALTRTQPPMFHRLVVRWWRLRGGARREPILARVEGGAKGRIKIQPVGRGVKQRTDRGFGLCADLAKRTVRGFWSLAAIRKELLADVTDASRSLRTPVRRRDVIDRVRAEMIDIVAEASGRLRDVGYDVPPDELAEDDQDL